METIFLVVVVISSAFVLGVAAIVVYLMGRDAWQKLNADCSHEYEWRGGGSTPDGPIEPEHVCRHCGAVNLEDR